MRYLANLIKGIVNLAVTIGAFVFVMHVFWEHNNNSPWWYTTLAAIAGIIVATVVDEVAVFILSRKYGESVTINEENLAKAIVDEYEKRNPES